MRAAELRQEALSRATGFLSTSNYGAIYAGFTGKGIPEDQIRPRENVFTFQAWKALGRYVRKGEHGVKITTWVPMLVKDTNKKTGEVERVGKSRPWTTTVFHVSQTEAVTAPAHEPVAV